MFARPQLGGALPLGCPDKRDNDNNETKKLPNIVHAAVGDELTLQYGACQ
jgi:hypothetical protein